MVKLKKPLLRSLNYLTALVFFLFAIDYLRRSNFYIGLFFLFFLLLRVWYKRESLNVKLSEDVRRREKKYPDHFKKGILSSSQQQEESNANHLKYMALQNQINPHFLYNTLEGIRSEALLGGVPTAAKMSELLATYFRYNISNIDKMATVEEELANVKNYFKIQKFRFEERLEMDLEFDEWEDEVKLCKIPKLILQPIVENAILHGIEPQMENGWITIRFMCYESRLVIVVSDTGIGIPPSVLEALNQSLNDAATPNLTEGIGIKNVNYRLKMIFGEDYGLRYFSKEGKGTDVEIHLPFETRNRS